jgi:alpha-glucoside transport system substrate-binding protein
MSRKSWQLLSGLLIFSLVLAGCAGPAATATPTAVQATETTVPTTAATSAASETPAASPTAAQGQPTGTQAALRTPQEAALAAAGGKKIGGTVSVLATWGGGEQDSFMAMVKPFEDATGVTVQYEGTRDINAVLTSRVQGGNPPDLAGLPGPGQMAQFATQGKLVDLTNIIDMAAYNNDYAKTWLDLGSVNGKMVGIFIKTSVKGLIWYDPKVWQQAGYQVPQSWDDMMKLSDQIASTGATPWCEAIFNGAASGWPGTDWIEDIVLRQSGADVYNNWWQGKVAWTSPEIKQAFQTWGQIVANPKMVYGGTNYVLSTDFSKVGDPLFTTPPGCYMVHQASFITSFFTTTYPNLKPVQDFNFFPFPKFNASSPTATEMAGDLFGMFKDTPQSEALIRYLVTPEAQAIWVQRGGAISPNKLVPLSLYPDDLSRKAAQLLTTADVAVFDASDMMPETMNNAFWKAILDYVQTPSNLDSILQQLDTTRASAYKQ